MTSYQGMETFARDVALMRQVGINPIIHGGVYKDKCHAEKTQIESQFINGKRVTDQPTMEVVEMVLSGSKLIKKSYKLSTIKADVPLVCQVKTPN